MCGILGIVARLGERPRITRRQLLAMRDTMTLRGPDGAGEFWERNVAFAHRRLAIRDMAGGVQPWVSPDETCVLVYNGEIYNDAELRRELEQHGHHFRTHCDTEVVMAAYQQWGADFLSKLRGMFSLAVYDFQSESLLLARDRFGVKPLFVTEADGCLIFASSIPALLRHPHFSKSPNFTVLSHYLTTLRLTLGRETVYENLWQLLPGEMLSWQRGQVEVSRYWSLPNFEQNDDNLSYADAVELLHAELRESTRIRLVSDVPVGMLLSGGVDSSLIAHMVREVDHRPLMAHCGGTSESDEVTFSRACASNVGFSFEAVSVGSEQYQRDWRWLLDQYETPVSTPSDVILLNLARRMKQHAGVVLGGEGADELLRGYAVQHWSGNDFNLLQCLNNGTWPGTTSSASVFRESFRKSYEHGSFKSLQAMYFGMNSLIPEAAKPSLFQPHVWKNASEDESVHSYYSEMFSEYAHLSSAVQMQRILHRVNLESLLSRLDSATMLGSLEARVPFTDHVLVEALLQIPQEYCIGIAESESSPYLAAAELQQRGTLKSKKVLRTLAKQVMPRQLAIRPKASFPTPAEKWLTGEWSGGVREQLRHSPFGAEIFQQDALCELADNLPVAGMWLWPLVNVLNWGDSMFYDQAVAA